MTIAHSSTAGYWGMGGKPHIVLWALKTEVSVLCPSLLSFVGRPESHNAK